MDILKIIRENHLIYLTIDKLSKRLAEISGESVTNLKEEINNLIHQGILFLDEGFKISISADRGFFRAKMVLNRKGFGFAQVEGFKDFFIPTFAINGAFDGDDCLVEITNMKSEQEIEGRVVRILSRNTKFVVGTYVEGKSKNVVFPDDDRLPQIRIFKNDSGKARNNDKVWVEINHEFTDEKNMRGKVIEVLGQANSPKAEQLSIIRSFGLVDHFEERVLSYAKTLPQSVDLRKFKKRENYTDHKVITIDGEDARDFDDALSIEKVKDGYMLYVHIADVSHYVTENDPIDKEAYRRGTSVYFPNQVIPMLPKELSNGICSLSEGVNRLVLTCVIHLDKKFKVMSSTIKEGVIKSSHRMTYTEVQNILAGDELLIEKYADVVEDIKLYREIAKKLEDDRIARGEIRMNIPEPFILENQSGEIISITMREQDESHRIIESLMILANECVAKTYFELAVPFVYRVHEKPDEERVRKLGELLKNMGVPNKLDVNGDQPASYQEIINLISGTPKERTLTIMILRTMMKARYAPSCLGHFGLASSHYCHFTSPIRRYPDLQIHRIIKMLLHGVPMEDIKMKYKSIVEQASEQSSKTEKNADEAEREVDDYKKAVYMTKFIGETFKGYISGVQEFGIFVELENGIEGLVRLDELPMDEYVYDELSLSLHGAYHHFTIGDEVEVIVANTNTRLRQIDFDLAGVEKGFAVLAGRKKKEKKKTKISSKSASKSKGKRRR